MKNKVIFGIIVFLFAMQVFPSGLKIAEYGVKFGLSYVKFSTITNYEDRIPTTKKTILGGFFYSIEFDKNIFLQNEIYYSTKGSIIKYEGNSYDYSISYVDTSHLIKIKFPVGRKVIPALLTGFFYNFNVSKSAYVTNANGLVEEINLDGKINKSEFGFVLGANIEYKLRKTSFIFDIRLNYGFNRVITDYIENVENSAFYNNTPGYRDINIKNRSINITIGYVF